FFQAEDGIRDFHVTGVQTCALPISYGSLDTVFNNAGIAGAVRPIHEWSSADWDHIVNVNLRSQFLVLKYAAMHMTERRAGAIVRSEERRVGKERRSSLAQHDRSDT